jgi:hypothetical protein
LGLVEFELSRYLVYHPLRMVFRTVVAEMMGAGDNQRGGYGQCPDNPQYTFA